MAIAAQVFAVCDVRRTPGCAANPTRLEIDPVYVEDVGEAVAELRAEAAALGWTSEPHEGAHRHACPACTKAGANDWALIGEKWRAQQAAKQAEAKRLAEAQRAPGESYAWPPGWQERARRRVVWGDMMNRPPGAAEEE
jgi:hypothetical protein